MQLTNHIIIKDGIAYIAERGHLKAEMVARMVVDGGYTVEETMEHYDLSASQVYSVLAYYYDNQTALDEAHEQKWANIRENALNADEYLQKLKSRGEK
ncbi:MAG: hypothetical protein SFZ02_21060 [bacterium]|nr:hypothetical protein [bacterium]